MIKGKGSSRVGTLRAQTPVLMLLFSSCQYGKSMYYTERGQNQYTQNAASITIPPFTQTAVSPTVAFFHTGYRPCLSLTILTSFN